LLASGDAPLDLEHAVDQLLERTNLAIVRVREGNTYRQLARSRDGLDEDWIREVPSEGDIPGFGDAMTCEALSRFLARPASGVAS
jgi:hypothetical protein